MPGGVSQLDRLKTIIIPCEAAFETSPTWSEVPLLGVPRGAGAKYILKYIGVMFHTAPADSSNNVKADIEVVDASNSHNVSNLVTAFDFTAATARDVTTIWRGSYLLDEGDTVNAEMDTTTPDTAGAGAAFIVEYEIEEEMAA